MSLEEPGSGQSPAKGRTKPPPRSRYNAYAKRLVQGAMASEGASYKRLAQLLKEDDPENDDTADSLLRRINRGTFPFAFTLQVLRVLGKVNIDISFVKTEADIREELRKRQKR